MLLQGRRSDSFSKRRAFFPRMILFCLLRAVVCIQGRATFISGVGSSSLVNQIVLPSWS